MFASIICDTYEYACYNYVCSTYYNTSMHSHFYLLWNFSFFALRTYIIMHALTNSCYNYYMWLCELLSKNVLLAARCVTKYCACIFCDKHAIKISNRFLMVYKICLGVFSIISNVHSQFIKNFENNRNHSNTYLQASAFLLEQGFHLDKMQQFTVKERF